MFFPRISIIRLLKCPPCSKNGSFLGSGSHHLRTAIVCSSLHLCRSHTFPLSEVLLSVFALLTEAEGFPGRVHRANMHGLWTLLSSSPPHATPEWAEPEIAYNHGTAHRTNRKNLNQPHCHQQCPEVDSQNGRRQRRRRCNDLR